MKNIINLLKISPILIFFFAQIALSEENKIVEKKHEWNFYSGMFDFSDHGKRSSLIGIQHTPFSDLSKVFSQFEKQRLKRSL